LPDRAFQGSLRDFDFEVGEIVEQRRVFIRCAQPIRPKPEQRLGDLVAFGSASML
jgi:hypothetical protein